MTALSGVLRPPSGSHIRTRAHYHRQHSNWVFVEQQPEGPDPDDGFEVWVIHKFPRDYPDKYVVRRYVIATDRMWVDDPPAAVTDTLEEARLHIAPKPRKHMDQFPDAQDPTIIEAWM